MTRDHDQCFGVSDLARIWCEAVAPAAAADDDAFSVDVARLVVGAVITAANGGGGIDLDDTGRRWAAICHRASEAIEALFTLQKVFTIYSSYDREAVRAAIETLVVVVASVADVVVSEAEKLSLTDPLTGVGNRRAFEQAFRHVAAGAGRSGCDVTVLMIDMNGLKQINDCHGHLAGDRALVTLTAAFSASMRASDTIYRIGGDEFVVLLPGAEIHDVAGLVARARAAGAPPFDFGAAKLLDHGADCTATIAAADAALYRETALLPGSFRPVRR